MIKCNVMYVYILDDFQYAFICGAYENRVNESQREWTLFLDVFIDVLILYTYSYIIPSGIHNVTNVLFLLLLFSLSMRRMLSPRSCFFFVDVASVDVSIKPMRR